MAASGRFSPVSNPVDSLLSLRRGRITSVSSISTWMTLKLSRSTKFEPARFGMYPRARLTLTVSPALDTPGNREGVAARMFRDARVLCTVGQSK